MLGIGCIIGTGIFVLTGVAAAQHAGPAIVLSFILSGIACAFAALCYAELAGAIGGAGSAYAYAYADIGESDRLDHRLGPHPGIRHRLLHRGRRLVRLFRTVSR